MSLKAKTNTDAELPKCQEPFSLYIMEIQTSVILEEAVLKGKRLYESESRTLVDGIALAHLLSSRGL